MPTYGYECKKCNVQFEIFQKITEDSLKIHENCGGELRKLVYPVGISFKGSGFYVNDYAKKSPSAKPAGATDKPETTDSPSASTDSKSESTSETKPETKTESKSEAAAPSSAPASASASAPASTPKSE